MPSQSVGPQDSFAFSGVFDSAAQGFHLGCGLITIVGGVAALAGAVSFSNDTGGTGLWWLIGLAAVGCILLYMAFDSLRKWTASRRRMAQTGPRVSGQGIRVSAEGTVEVGLFQAQIVDESSLKAGRSIAHKAAVWIPQYTCTGQIEVLVNIMKTEQRGWMVANLVVTSDGQSLQKDFINVRVDSQSSAWISTQGQETWLSPYNVAKQFELLSSVLGLIRPPGSNNRLKVTFTESGTAGGGLVQVASANSQQNKLNERLAQGLLPLNSPIPTAAVSSFGYEICPNEHAKAFRKW